MTIITPDLTRQFIREVRLPAAPRRRRALTDEPPIELKATEAQSLVVGSGLINAAENVPVQTREDLINCTLFAQLAASGAVSSPMKVAEWYSAYFRTLTALGWAQSDTQFQEYNFNSINVEAHKAIMQVLAVLLGPQSAALVVVKTTLDALQSMNENSPWITLFDRQSRSEKFARFQVATAQLDSNGLLQTALVGFQLKAKSTLTQVLFFKFSKSSTTVKYAAGKATIYEAALADQRADIAKRLAAYRSAYIGQVQFPPPPGAGTRGMRRTIRRAGRRKKAVKFSPGKYLRG
jgi:hypothetical protein